MDSPRIIVLSAGEWHPQWSVVSMQSVCVDEFVYPMVAIDGAYNDWESNLGRIIRTTYGYRGAAQNYFGLIRKIPDVFKNSDIVVFLDLDDQLLPGAFERVRVVYRDSKTWVTHGSYRTMSGAPARFNGPYPKGNRKIRNAPWRASHLRTARLGLVRRLKLEHFLGPDGNWLDVCFDMASMFPLIEMAGIERVKYIPDEIYLYNDLNPRNDHKIRGEEQKKVERWLRSQPKEKWLNSLE